MAIKTYVKVGYKTDEEGNVTPQWLVFRKRRYEIDRLLDVGQAHAINIGGFGMRYLVRIENRKAYLFQEDSLRWFVEEKIPGEIPQVGGIVIAENYSFLIVRTSEPEAALIRQAFHVKLWALHQWMHAITSCTAVPPPGWMSNTALRRAGNSPARHPGHGIKKARLFADLPDDIRLPHKVMAQHGFYRRIHAWKSRRNTSQFG